MRPTKRAVDWRDSARFTSIFLASGFFCSQTFSQPARQPLTQAVRRNALFLLLSVAKGWSLLAPPLPAKILLAAFWSRFVAAYSVFRLRCLAHEWCRFSANTKAVSASLAFSVKMDAISVCPPRFTAPKYLSYLELDPAMRSV